VRSQAQLGKRLADGSPVGGKVKEAVLQTAVVPVLTGYYVSDGWTSPRNRQAAAMMLVAVSICEVAPFPDEPWFHVRKPFSRQ
jgi:hypothetical protein